MTHSSCAEMSVSCLRHHRSWVLDLCTQPGLHLGFLEFPACTWQTGDFSPPYEPIPIIKVPVYLYIYYWFCFSAEHWLILRPTAWSLSGLSAPPSLHISHSFPFTLASTLAYPGGPSGLPRPWHRPGPLQQLPHWLPYTWSFKIQIGLHQPPLRTL